MRTNEQVEKTVSAGAGKFARSRSQLASDFNTLVADAEDLLKTTATYSGETVTAARSRFRDTLDQFKTSISDAQGAVAARLDRTAAMTQDYARENPWKLMGGAVLVGVIVGMLMHRR